MIHVYCELRETKASMRIEGHADYCQEGYDPLCAAISSYVLLLQELLCAIGEPQCIREVRRGYAEMDFPDSCGMTIAAMLLAMGKLERLYPSCIKIEPLVDARERPQKEKKDEHTKSKFAGAFRGTAQ